MGDHASSSWASGFASPCCTVSTYIHYSYMPLHTVHKAHFFVQETYEIPVMYSVGDTQPHRPHKGQPSQMRSSKPERAPFRVRALIDRGSSGAWPHATRGAPLFSSQFYSLISVVLLFPFFLFSLLHVGSGNHHMEVGPSTQPLASASDPYHSAQGGCPATRRSTRNTWLLHDAPPDRNMRYRLGHMTSYTIVPSAHSWRSEYLR